MPTVISVENLSKAYRLGQIGTGRLTDDLKVWWARHRGLPNPLLPVGRTDRGKGVGETIWALEDVSFSVEQGEVLGVIGRNGAGKSTLLKILSRITAPTSGSVKVKGRIASLLEIGTGFHPELTGRENIFLNGAILGMNRKETDRKFDAIVDFAEIAQFIDTPVKRYSSGMYVRLAFAVAAHLEPEILLVDEVLAVGDLGFQKKSLGKMSDVAREGRTVLFVSHNMAAIQNLCETSALLESGHLAFLGATETAIQTYLQADAHTSNRERLRDRRDRWGNGHVQISDVRFMDQRTRQQTDIILVGMPVLIEVDYEKPIDREIQDFDIAITFYNSFGELMFACRSSSQGRLFRLSAPRGTLQCRIPKWPLSSGVYSYNLWASSHAITLDSIRAAGEITTEKGDFYGTGKLPGGRNPKFFVEYDWTPTPEVSEAPQAPV
jgi:lipopolysaccharide transport system ATP-binding protein